MIVDIEPVMIENGAYNVTDDNDISFSGRNGSAQTGIWGAKPNVTQSNPTDGDKQVEDTNMTDSNDTQETYDLDAN